MRLIVTFPRMPRGKKPRPFVYHASANDARYILMADGSGHSSRQRYFHMADKQCDRCGCGMVKGEVIPALTMKAYRGVNM